MILESVKNSPVIWPTVEENEVARTKKYADYRLLRKFKLIVMKETNIILQGEDPIACLNMAMAFLTGVTFSRGYKVKVIPVLVLGVMLLVLGETMQVDMKGLLNAITIQDLAYDDVESKQYGGIK
nr:hypothetical protein [Tanacetum cinerariifolium]